MKNINDIENQCKRKSNEAGYSLLEILVVLAIIGTLITLVAPRLLGNVDKSKVIAAQAQVRNLRLALDSFNLDMGRYPTKSEGLLVLVNEPNDNGDNWFGPYLEGGVPSDPWQNDFIYAVSYTHLTLPTIHLV